MTIHYGQGYIDPFGEANYFCGVVNAEVERFPLPDDPSSAWSELIFGFEANPALMCIYTLRDGQIFTYSEVFATMHDDPTGNSLGDGTGEVHKDALTEIVVGGTGAFEGISGTWVGQAVGRAQRVEIRANFGLPETIIKTMHGHVRIPKDADE